MTYKIAPEIEDYFWEKYDKCGIKVVPGHWPVMNTKEDVDRWIDFISNMTDSIFEDKAITHALVKDIFNDTYNVFYKKWKDTDNDEDFLQMWEEAKALKNKYNDEHGLCEAILLKLCEIIEDNCKRRNNHGK